MSKNSESYQFVPKDGDGWDVKRDSIAHVALFTSQGDTSHIASIDPGMQLAELASHYIRAANTLISVALEDTKFLDVHALPTCFLYRHGLELLLKDLAWRSHYLVTGEKIFSKENWGNLGQHRLSSIWNKAKVSAKKAFNRDFPLTSNEVVEVESCLSDIEKYDSDSFAFRYPFDKQSKRTHPELTNINLAIFRDKINQTVYHIASILDMIDYYISANQDAR